MDDLDGEDLVVGEDMVIGALQRMMGRQARGGSGAYAPQTSGGRNRGVFNAPPLRGQSTWPHTSKLRSYMGFGFATWGPTDATDKPLPVQPQESFRGERLII